MREQKNMKEAVVAYRNCDAGSDTFPRTEAFSNTCSWSLRAFKGHTSLRQSLHGRMLRSSEECNTQFRKSWHKAADLLQSTGHLLRSPPTEAGESSRPVLVSSTRLRASEEYLDSIKPAPLGCLAGVFFTECGTI